LAVRPNERESAKLLDLLFFIVTWNSAAVRSGSRECSWPIPKFPRPGLVQGPRPLAYSGPRRREFSWLFAQGRRRLAAPL